MANLRSMLIEFSQEILSTLGTGHSERIYQNALLAQLRKSDISHDSEVTIPLHYKGAYVGFFRLDIVVAGQVVVELKVGHDIRKTDVQQLEKYLRHTDYEEGLLLNFSSELMYREI